jgi:hypothetical protein
LAGFHEVRIDDLQPEAIEGFLGHWSPALFPCDERSAESHLAYFNLILSGIKKGCSSPFSGDQDQPRP